MTVDEAAYNDDDDDGDEEEAHLLLLIAAIQSNADVLTIITARLQDNEQRRQQEESTFARLAGERNPTIFDERLRWDLFVKKFGDRAEFKRHIRMSVESFDILLGYIRERLEVDAEMARRRGGQIYPELCLYACLRFLAGGSYSHLRFFTGLSSLVASSTVAMMFVTYDCNF